MMKKWFTLVFCVWMSGWACAQSGMKTQAETAKNYEIHGRISGEYKGKVYFVKEEKLHGAQTVIDSCDVVEGKFHFKGEAPEHAVIYFVKSQDGQLAPVFLEAGRIVMNVRANHFLGAETKGTINNNLWQLHQLQTKYWLDSILLATNTDWMRFGYGPQEVEAKNFEARTNLQNSKKLNMERYMVKYYNNEAFAPFIMLFEMTHELSLNELKALRGQLHERLADHPYTKELDEVIVNKEFKVGMDAPAFSIKGMDGKEIELKNYLGKYVLIDFWASWCGPCRREMPNIVKLYKDCKGKNFEIIGISLDQKEADWKKSVKDLGMNWPQGCDFQVWESPIARKYNVSTVPYTVLVNPAGKIEAIDLRGEELTSTIKTLLKQKK